MDQDQDGHGEYLLLGELAGTKSRRGNDSTAMLTFSNPSFIAKDLGPKNDSSVVKKGYRFQVFLPGIKKFITDDGKSEASPISPYKHPEIINIQETEFRLYAWPEKFKYTGIRCFAINQAGEVIFADNVKGKKPLYSGKLQKPAFDAAVSSRYNDAPDTFEGNFCAGELAKDGQIK